MALSEAESEHLLCSPDLRGIEGESESEVTELNVAANNFSLYIKKLMVDR